MKKFFKKYWLFVLLAMLATILAFFYFNPQKKSIEKKDNLLPLNAPEIKYYSSSAINLNALEDNYPSFKKDLEVYQVDDVLINNQEALKIAQNLGYIEVPIVINDADGPIYNWSNDLSNLSIYLKKGRGQYGLDLLRNPELISGQPPSIKEAENEYQKLLKEKDLIPKNEINLEIVEKDFYLNGGTNFIKTTLIDSQKNFTFLKSIYKINNFKIDGPEMPFISLYFGSNFQIARFDFNKIFNQVDLIDVYPIKTKDEVIKEIKSNPQISFLKDSASFYQENIIEEEEISNLKNLSFNKIEIIYYRNINKQTSLQPVFLITGKALIKDGTQVESGLYLPAVKNEYLLR